MNTYRDPHMTAAACPKRGLVIVRSPDGLGALDSAADFLLSEEGGSAFGVSCVELPLYRDFFVAAGIAPPAERMALAGLDDAQGVALAVGSSDGDHGQRAYWSQAYLMSSPWGGAEVTALFRRGRNEEWWDIFARRFSIPEAAGACSEGGFGDAAMSHEDSLRLRSRYRADEALAESFPRECPFWVA